MLLAVVGLLLIALANYDALVTTLAVGSGSRPLSARVATGLRHVLRRTPRLLPAGGPLVVLGTVGLWIGLLWTGWSVLFSADPDGVVSTATQTPASALERAYFAGYTLITLGNGEFRPLGGGWQLATVLAALNGLFVTTLAITFMVPVVGAVVQRRRLAATVSALGPTAEDVLLTCWDGRAFSYLEAQLPSLAGQVALTAQRHLAYPVLHDFRSSDASTSSERTLALLDDVCMVLAHGVQPQVRPARAVTATLRAAITDARALMPVEAGDAAPPPLPDLSVLHAHGIPVCDQTDLAAAAADLADHRRHLAAMVGSASWCWPNRAGLGTS
jgi:hypothetical protein